MVKSFCKNVPRASGCANNMQPVSFGALKENIHKGILAFYERPNLTQAFVNHSGSAAMPVFNLLYQKLLHYYSTLQLDY